MMFSTVTTLASRSDPDGESDLDPILLIFYGIL
jgi:hypothetical protein